MSATHDKTQKFTFVYSNLYRIYKDAKNGEALKTGEVLKAGEIQNTQTLTIEEKVPKVRPYRPTELLGKRTEIAARKAEVLSQTACGPSLPQPFQKFEVAKVSMENLRNNLEQLDKLQHRLRFMLQELQELQTVQQVQKSQASQGTDNLTTKSKKN